MKDPFDFVLFCVAVNIEALRWDLSIGWGTEIGFSSSHAGLAAVCLSPLDLLVWLLSNGTNTISFFLLSPSRQSVIGIQTMSNQPRLRRRGSVYQSRIRAVIPPKLNTYFPRQGDTCEARWNEPQKMIDFLYLSGQIEGFSQLTLSKCTQLRWLPPGHTTFNHSVVVICWGAALVVLEMCCINSRWCCSNKLCRDWLHKIAGSSRARFMFRLLWLDLERWRFPFCLLSLLSRYRRRSHRLPVRHLPHPPPGLPHEEEGRGQLRPGREETLRRRLPEGPDQGVLCIEAGPAPPRPPRHQNDKNRKWLLERKKKKNAVSNSKPVQIRQETSWLRKNSIKESFCIEYCN